MCTVTYIPTGKEAFIFTSNRDEAPKRSAKEIAKEQQGEKTILFPRDALAKGTWIAVSDKNQLVCILNGAFQKHKHKPPYRLSRGIMALDFFSNPNAKHFFDHYYFEGIEPFTMIIYDDGALYEFRWDAVQQHILPLDTTQPYIWASCTLYSQEWQDKRKSWFADWRVNNKEVHQSNVLDFHKNAGEGNAEFDVVMNRDNRVRTTSITSVLNNQSQMSMRYEDLLNRTIVKEVLSLTSHSDRV